MPLGHTEQPGERVAAPDLAATKGASPEGAAISTAGRLARDGRASDVEVKPSDPTDFEKGHAPLARITPVKMAVAANGMQLNSGGAEVSETKATEPIRFEDLSFSDPFSKKLREAQNNNPATDEFVTFVTGKGPQAAQAAGYSADLHILTVGKIFDLAQFKIRAAMGRLGFDPHQRGEVLKEMPATQVALVKNIVRENIAPLVTDKIAQVLDSFSLADRGEVNMEMPSTGEAMSLSVDMIRAGANGFIAAKGLNSLSFPSLTSQRMVA
jgi:hypothetical protein